VFGFLRTKSPKKRSVLSRQRVKAAPKDGHPSTQAWSLAAKGLIAVLLLVVCWAITLRIFDKLGELGSYVNATMALPPKEWRIEVINSSGGHLPEEIKREVYRVAARSIKTGSPSELRLLAKNVESLGNLESVRVVRPVVDTVVLTAEIRQPALLIDVGGKTRFLANDASVFGDVAEASPHSPGGRPIVKVMGIFDQRPNPVVDSSTRVITTSDERRHIQEALEIWRLVAENNISIKSINFQKFRGYALFLSDETEIIIGLKPFDYKLKKLRSILDGLSRDGILASRIELDYEGKAFIKERKL